MQPQHCYRASPGSNKAAGKTGGYQKLNGGKNNSIKAAHNNGLANVRVTDQEDLTPNKTSLKAHSGRSGL